MSSGTNWIRRSSQGRQSRETMSERLMKKGTMPVLDRSVVCQAMIAFVLCANSNYLVTPDAVQKQTKLGNLRGRTRVEEDVEWKINKKRLQESGVNDDVIKGLENLRSGAGQKKSLETIFSSYEDACEQFCCVLDNKKEFLIWIDFISFWENHLTSHDRCAHYFSGELSDYRTLENGEGDFNYAALTTIPVFEEVKDFIHPRTAMNPLFPVLNFMLESVVPLPQKERVNTSLPEHFFEWNTTNGDIRPSRGNTIIDVDHQAQGFMENYIVDFQAQFRKLIAQKVQAQNAEENRQAQSRQDAAQGVMAQDHREKLELRS